MAPAGAAAARAHVARHKKEDAANGNGLQPSAAAGDGAHRVGTHRVPKKAKKVVEEEVLTGIWKWQNQARRTYKHTNCEVFVAGLICGNFVINIVEKTIDPTGEEYTEVFAGCEYFFNAAFTIELVVNMYSHWLKPFWKSGWNVFDFVVVTIGILTTINVPLPGPFKMLRMMRAFRVFRLFKRIESLRKIMASLANAVPGVINALVILVLVMCIYAILGVELWLDYGAGGFIVNEFNVTVPYQTPRDQDYGHEYFGNFPKSWFTMFQVMTTESWCEAIARVLISTPSTIDAVATAFFYVSFSILCGIILVNVAVAVLLEKMVEKEEDADVDFGEEQPDDLAAEVETLKGDLCEMKLQLTKILNFIHAQQDLSNLSKLPQVGLSTVMPPQGGVREQTV
mmetsp:Transcript_28530/g.75545  ORF Transcript_28530/g.75545 Transcript_28530/m.75545 type:complete len:397 (+) Transcript_28530:52-1242(+)